MKIAQFALLVFAIVLAIASTVEAGKKKKPSKKPTQVVRWNKKMSGVSTWFNGHDLKGVSCTLLHIPRYIL